MKKIAKKIISILLIFSLISFSFAFAEWEEWDNSNSSNTETSTESSNNIPVIADDPRVKVLTDSELATHVKKIKVKVDNWPHKHKLRESTGALLILHKPAWMYLQDNKINCEESGPVYFITNKDWQKIKKIALNCIITFDDENKTKDVVNETFKDIKTSSWETNNSTSNDDIDVNKFLDDIVGYNSYSKLREVRLENKVFAVSSKVLAKTIKNYSINKQKIYFWEYSEFNGLKNREYYNSKIVKLFDDFSKILCFYLIWLADCSSNHCLTLIDSLFCALVLTLFTPFLKRDIE